MLMRRRRSLASRVEAIVYQSIAKATIILASYFTPQARGDRSSQLFALSASSRHIDRRMKNAYAPL